LSLPKVLLKIQWIFVILLSLYIIRNFRGTSSPAEGVHGQRKVGNPCFRVRWNTWFNHFRGSAYPQGSKVVHSQEFSGECLAFIL